MTKKLMIGAALGALMVSGALAQSPTSPSSSGPTPPAAAAQTPSSGGKGDLVTSQKPDQWLATKFRGTEVDSADNQKIGAVTDILFDKTGTIQAFVVSVGGFLGMGAKEIALAPASFDVVPGQNGAADKLKLSMSQDEIKQAQNFTPYQPPRPTTTGSGAPGGLNSLPGGTHRPSTNTPPTGR
ncbi:MAG: PRC-barrel domain-containing protein [Pseudolabrys sp.]